MEFTLIELLNTFFFSILLGIGLGLLYEPFSIFHYIGFKSKMNYLICDILFTVIASVVTYLFYLVTIEGRIRMFVIWGELLGFFIYKITLGKIFAKIYRPVLKICKKIFVKLLKISRNLMYNISARVKWVVTKFNNLIIKVFSYGKRKEKKKSLKGFFKYKRSKAQKEKKK